jgi:hypothetical protein
MCITASVKHDLLYRTTVKTTAPATVVRVAVSLSEVQDVTRSLGRTLLVGLLLFLFRINGGLLFSAV